MNQKHMYGIIADIIVIIAVCSCLFFYIHQAHIQAREIVKINNRLEKIEYQLNKKEW